MPIQGLDPNRDLESYCVEYVEGVYKIYSDGAVVTVDGYSGLGDLYNEALNTIYTEEVARGVDIQSANHITSSQEFHTMLVEQLNADNIAKVEREQSLRVVSDIEEQPLVKSMQRVITTINFCCRVDLEDGSIYIGEGYENLLSYALDKTGAVSSWHILKSTGGATSNVWSYFIHIYEVQDYIPYPKGLGKENQLPSKTGTYTGTHSNDLVQGIFEILAKYPANGYSENSKITGIVQATKTSTPKPFVKSHMPSGKLAFITCYKWDS